MGPLKNPRLTPGRVSLVCRQCGSTFVRFRSQLNPEWAGPFCSLSCSSKFKNAGRKNPNYHGGPVAKTCAVCEAEFSVARHKIITAKYCSRACQHASLAGRPSPKKIQLAEKRCASCTRSFVPTRKNAKYCSLDCKHAGQSQAVRGERSGRYVHGNAQSAYPRGWNRGLKGQIRRRDGFECRYCFKPQSEQRRALPVHHIDYIKPNLSQNNLITLCDVCHGMMHGALSVRAVWQTILEPMVSETGTC